ncbi:hypothetical protein LCGC14_1334010, partial [marine sediment metagenome]
MLILRCTVVPIVDAISEMMDATIAEVDFCKTHDLYHFGGGEPCLDAEKEFEKLLQL